MPTLTFTSELAVPQQAVWEFHSSVNALLQITPPSTRVRLAEPPGPMEKGARFTLMVTQPPLFFPVRWCTEITAYQPPEGFTDIQVPGRGPFAFWQHEHRFEKMNPDRTRLVDRVTYRLPVGLLGALADRLFLRRQLSAMFAYRHRVTKALLERV